jgi:hypothetical protein
VISELFSLKETKKKKHFLLKSKLLIQATDSILKGLKSTSLDWKVCVFAAVKTGL